MATGGGFALTLALVAGSVAGQERMREHAADTSRAIMDHGMMQSGMSGMMQRMHGQHGMMGGGMGMMGGGMMGGPVLNVEQREKLALAPPTSPTPPAPL